MIGGNTLILHITFFKISKLKYYISIVAILSNTNLLGSLNSGASNIYYGIPQICISKGPVVNHYPIPTKRTPSQASDYFIPFGWAIFLHDYTTGVPSAESIKDPISIANAEMDWTEGTLDKINNSADPWNVVWA